MLDYILGDIAEITPIHVVLELNNIGYDINISLFSYSQLQKQVRCKLYLHQVIREDAHVLFGFSTLEERKIFRMLISVSGVGASTARVILSSMSPEEVQQAIAEENVTMLQSVKGIGAKTAQRIIVDLKDKVMKSGDSVQIFKSEDNTKKKEALSALEILGFSRKQSEKVVDKLLLKKADMPIEELIKEALRLL
jgi:Holliday junction DNA helicase RuvA